MTVSDVSARWADARRSLREKAAHLTPKIVTSYPFEVFVTFLGFLIGFPILAGLVAPTSLVLLLPKVAYWAYGSALMLGAGTLVFGLRKKHALVLASGLQLLGGAFAVYGLAVVAVAGWVTAWAAFAAFVCLGLVCLIRAAHFRRLIDIEMGARRLPGGDQ